MNVPIAFISYSHDSQEHKKWALELAIRLRNNGIDAIIDQFELKAGDDLPHFMETNLAKSDKIIMICTERYVEKANNGEGGVGYEKMIITSSLLKKIDENKIIPIVKQQGATNLPTFLKSKLYINFSKEDDFEFNYDDLVRNIHNSPLFEKPPIGNNPFKLIKKEELNGDQKLLDSILKLIAEKQGIDTELALSKLRLFTTISDVMLKIVILKLVKLGYIDFVFNQNYVCMTEKGLLYGLNKNLIS